MDTCARMWHRHGKHDVAAGQHYIANTTWAKTALAKTTWGQHYLANTTCAHVCIDMANTASQPDRSEHAYGHFMDWCIEMCIDLCVDVHRHLYRQVWGRSAHVHGHCIYSCIYSCMGICPHVHRVVHVRVHAHRHLYRQVAVPVACEWKVAKLGVEQTTETEVCLSYRHASKRVSGCAYMCV